METKKVENFVKVLRQWQAIERQSINNCAEVQEETNNPLIRMIMEIIRHDSLMHHRVQQFLIDNVTGEKTFAVSREDVAAIWEKIEEHDKIEKRTIDLARTIRDEAWNPIHKQLLDYLLRDEEKHDTLIGNLEEIKKEMSKASGG
jgi:hypothetical protein